MMARDDPFLPVLHRALQCQTADRVEEAEKLYRSVLDAAPEHPMALHLLGVLLGKTARAAEGAVCLRKSIQLNPHDPQAHNNLANVLLDLGHHEAAFHATEQALALNPTYVKAWRARSNALHGLKRYGDAARVLQHLWTLDSSDPYVLGELMYMRLHACDWAQRQTLVNFLDAQLQSGHWAAPPFTTVMYSGDPAVQLAAARVHIETTAAARPHLALPPRVAAEKLRIAYLSADLHTHATAYLVAELFELHDRSQFEVWAVSFGPHDNGPMRQRLQQGVDHFVAAQDWSDQQIAELLAQAHVDIVIDLKGLTQHARPGIFQYRPAPVIVNYLGYPGTMGAACFDYIVGDPVVTPFAHAAFYSEKIVQLPHSYQVNDRQREIAPGTPTRQQQGLPAEGFVFACFNNNYKITPEVFDVWMRLLARVEGSVLWLLADNNTAVANLQREAAARGVASERLVFAPRAPLPEHLARHRLADLFLDTLPCNAHTTASDALWAGLPVLTCLGTTFAGRVAASLLTAIGLPELITDSLEAYEVLALRLATQPAQLQDSRRKLNTQRDTSALFDTPQFTAHLEKAYLQMHERHQQGLPPAAMAIS